MKKLTREPGVPTISASVFLGDLAMTGSGGPSFPKLASSKALAPTAFARVEELIHQVLLDTNAACHRCATNISEKAGSSCSTRIICASLIS